jgi:hypothetical protein
MSVELLFHAHQYPSPSHAPTHIIARDPNDKSTWHAERTNMPSRKRIPVSEVAPTAWTAICDLCGGEDRVHESARTWSDGFIVNLGSPEGEGKEIAPKDLDNCKVFSCFRTFQMTHDYNTGWKMKAEIFNVEGNAQY